MKKKNKFINLFIFGASGEQGFWDTKGGWTIRLKIFFDSWMVKNKIDSLNAVYFYPMGIAGDTTKDILERFEFETEKRIDVEGCENILIFSVGKNDTAFLPLSDSEKNLREIMRRAKKYSGKIAFLEVIPVNEKITKPTGWDNVCYYDNPKIIAFNKLLNKIAKENDVKVVRIFNELIKSDYTRLLRDGVHPNDRGHEYIFRKVRDFLSKKFIKIKQIQKGRP